MAQKITSSDLRNVLQKWAQGELSAQGVHDWAESRYIVDEWESENEAVNEMLGLLDRLDMNLIIKEDVPAFLAILDLGLESEDLMASKLDEYFKSINMKERKQKLSQDPFYEAFCK